jgi:excisionase family DNA binding protein
MKMGVTSGPWEFDQPAAGRLMERRSSGIAPMTKTTYATSKTAKKSAPVSPALAAESLPLALTIRETSTVLRLDARIVREMVRAGELVGNRRGHAIRVSRDSVLRWLGAR